MADKLKLDYEVRELKIGASFTNKASSFHTLKCDFKPASVDINKMATLEVCANNQVTVTVPHTDSSGVPQTVFKGNQRSYQKECVLIIDRVTGEMILERLSGNIQVKKTRQEPPHKPAPVSTSAPRPHTPIDANNCTQRSSSRTPVTSGGRRTNTNSIRVSPPRHRTSPPQAAPWSANAGQSTLASLPMIPLDDMLLSQVESQPVSIQHPPMPTNGHTTMDIRNPMIPPSEPEVGVLSSSSSSSSSDSDSDHSDSGGGDSDAEINQPQQQMSHNSKPSMNGGVNGVKMGAPEASMPHTFLNDDLCLSESGSDDD